ncbi:MAG: ECF transporter S component [Alistipes sp.]|nr:ECF transporter S component [Alistipes sp.]
MQTSSVKLYSFGYGEARTYMVAALFVLGNIALPQLCHLVPQGGLTWLPIYFFTLVGAYKYGWRVGLLTAVLSPLVNCAAFGMPAVASLPAILLKSAVLAGAAGYAAYRFKRVSLAVMVGVVLFYQAVGTIGEWIMVGDLFDALQDFRIGIPGMLLQIFGGWAIIRFVLKR